MEDVALGRGTYAEAGSIAAANTATLKANPNRLAVVVSVLTDEGYAHVSDIDVAGVASIPWGIIYGRNEVLGLAGHGSRIFHVDEYGVLVTGKVIISAHGGECAYRELLQNQPMAEATNRKVKELSGVK